MTDYATTNITTAPAPAPSLVSVTWEQNLGLSFIVEMQARQTPRTPLGGAGGARPTMGLIFPR